MTKIVENLQVIHDRIAMSARNALRDPTTVSLLAVSKGISAHTVCEAARAGQKAFGENYVQEAMDKMIAVHSIAPELSLSWHFIGPIQNNKTRLIATYFDWVHSVDQEKSAQRLSAQRPDDTAPLSICIQVNIDDEITKGGVAPEEVLTLAKKIMGLPKLRLRGLMALPKASASFEQQRLPFQAMRHILEQCCAEGIPMDTLSMGMSADWPAAIAEGATIIRIGTTLFGSRNEQKHHALL